MPSHVEGTLCPIGNHRGQRAAMQVYSACAQATTAASLSSGSPSTFRGGQTRLAPHSVTFLLRMSAAQQK